MLKRGTVIKNRCFHILKEAWDENATFTFPETLQDAPGTLPDAPGRSQTLSGRSWALLGRSRTLLGRSQTLLGRSPIPGSLESQDPPPLQEPLISFVKTFLSDVFFVKRE